MIIHYPLELVGIPLFEVCARTKFWTHYKGLYKSFSFSQENIQLNQKDKLVYLLNSAGRHVPYWQEVFLALGISPDALTSENIFTNLEKLPITNKQTYKNGFPDRITNSEFHNNWQYLSTAGTTDRMSVITDFNKRDYLRAAEFLNLKLLLGSPLGRPCIDIPPHACNVVCGLADEGPEPIKDYLFWCFKNTRFGKSELSDVRGRIERQILLKRRTLLPIDIGPWQKMSSQLDDYLDLILRDDIEILRGLPHFLLWLSKRAQQRGLKFPKLCATMPFGALASKELSSQISRGFEADFLNSYGTGEVGAIGVSLEMRESISTYQDLQYIEILDNENNSVPVGTIGRVVITDLNNLAMPLIRYDLGDIGLVNGNKNNTSNQEITIMGRAKESLFTPSGELITARQLQDTFFSHNEIINFQIKKISKSVFKVSVVTLSKIDEQELALNLQSLLELKKAPAINYVPFIMPEASGKFLHLKLLNG